MRLQHGFAEETVMTPNKGEIKLAVACGRVELVEEKPEQFKVVTNVDGFKFPPGGRFFSRGNEDILKILRTASENGYDMILRYERVRKKEVSNDIPIEELIVDMSTAQKSIFKSFAGIYNVKDGRWISFGESNPEEDPETIKQVVNNAVSGSRSDLTADSFFNSNNSEEVANTDTGTIQQSSMLVNDKDKKLQYLSELFFLIRNNEDKHSFSINSNYARVKLAKELLNLLDNAYKFITKEEVVNYNSFKYEQLFSILVRYEDTISPLNKENISNFKEWYNDFSRLIGEFYN